MRNSEAKPSSEKLKRHAYRVADAYRSGGLRSDDDRSWPDTWSRLLKELAKRCAGFSRADYEAALGQAFFDSR
jgi:hypothetical protein